MISGCMSEGCVEDAEEISEKSAEKDVIIFNAMIEGYTLEVGQQLHGQLVKIKYVKDVKIGSALTDIWNMAQNGKSCEAFEMFGWMQTEHHIKSNSVTVLSDLPACAHARLIGEGQKIFKSLERDFSLRPRKERYVSMVDLMVHCKYTPGMGICFGYP
ncbi:hypothetical protein Ancab_005315 [Ancistrocladus abbreviatus]